MLLKPGNSESQGKARASPSRGLRPLTHSYLLSLTLPFACFSRLTEHNFYLSTALWLPASTGAIGGISQGPCRFKYCLGDSWHCPLGHGGNVISDHREAQGVSLSFSHCPMWNVPAGFSFPPYSHNKVSFLLPISMSF